MRAYDVNECPFCGSGDLCIQPVLDRVPEDREGTTVKCRNCRLTGPIMPDAQKAVYAWNQLTRKE